MGRKNTRTLVRFVSIYLIYSVSPLLLWWNQMGFLYTLRVLAFFLTLSLSPSLSICRLFIIIDSCMCSEKERWEVIMPPNYSSHCFSPRMKGKKLLFTWISDIYDWFFLNIFYTNGGVLISNPQSPSIYRE